MVSVFTPILNLNAPALGDDVNTWGAPILNSNFTVLDQVVGSSASINLGSGGTTVLTNVQAAYMFLALTGALTSNAVLQLPSGFGGRRYIWPQTSGAFTI